MKTKTIQINEGELLGPVDWSFDFEKHTQNTNKDRVARSIACLKQICDEPDAKWEVMSPYTHNWQELLAVGMYDGWPYWRPVPSVCVSTWLGGEWHDFMYLMGVLKR